jgi:predicted transcriptional regulator
MENNEISAHEVRLYQTLLSSEWVTSKDAAHKSNVAARTARHHLRRLVELGICDLAEVFPAHRYRISKMASKRNKAYLLRLEYAMEALKR